LDVIECCVIRGDHAGPRTCFDRHIADRHASFHRQAANRRTAILQNVTLPAAGPDLRNHSQDDVLCRHPLGQVALHVDRHRLERLQRQGLSRENVLNLAGSNAECQGTEGSMRAGVGIPAHDRHARLRQPHLRTNDVHNALLDVPERIQRDTELCAVRSQRFDLRSRHRIGDRLVHIDGRNVVIFRGHREIRTTHRSVGTSKTVEGLRAGHLVHQMQIDVQQIRFTFGRPDDVVVPHLLGQSATH